MKTTLWTLALVSWLGQSGVWESDAWAAGSPPPVPAYVAGAVADTARPPADIARDARRKPAELLAFAGLKPGDSVADLMPGGGYFTRIFSKIVGPKGHVYAIIPDSLAKKLPRMVDAIRELTADPAFSNVTMLIEPIGGIAAPNLLDMVWTSDNYHDLYGQMGADAAEAADKAILKALKPGGIYMVIDHAAAAGAAGTATTTLHRIERATVEQQVTAAGFVLAGDSQILHNPDDPHTARIFDPAIRGETDQFVLKFTRPNG